MVKKAVVNSATDEIPYYSALQEAGEGVHGNKGEDYGHPVDDFTAVAKAMNAYLEKKYGEQAAVLGPVDIPIFQIIVKMMREANRPKRDNRVDMAGYAETLEMVHHRFNNLRF